MASDEMMFDHPAVQRYAKRLRLLRDIDRAILSNLSVEQTADAALLGLRQLVPCVRASVALFDLDTEEVILLATQGDSPQQPEARARAQLSPTFFLGASARGEPHIIEDLSSFPVSHPWVAALRAEGVQGYASLPLVTNDRVMGVLAIGLSDPGSPNAESLEIAADIANQLAVAVFSARLREQALTHALEMEHHAASRTEALRISEGRFRTIFEVAPVGMLVADRHGGILQANPALARMFGCAGEALQGRMLPDLGADERNRRELRARLNQLVQGNDRFFRLESRLRREDSSTLWAYLTIAQAPNAASDDTLIVGMLEDVTEERKTRAALIQAERQAITGRLGASLAHEINNPLQSIIGCVGLAEEILPPENEARPYLEVARSELHRVARTVAQLRDLQRATKTDRLAPVNLNEMLAKLLKLNEPKCGELGITVAWQPAPRLPLLSLQPDRMRQVFLNLILNAMDAMQGGGCLTVRTARTRQPAGVRVIVRDTGEGMPPAVLAQLFEPFYSTKRRGLGLGMFTSRSIVEEHGGTIEARSRPTRGTAITVWLPTRPAQNN